MYVCMYVFMYLCIYVIMLLLIFIHTDRRCEKRCLVF